jgi:hypothetical protein
MAKKVIDGTIDSGQGYPIQPGHINTDRHFYDGFGEHNTEISANLIVRLCKKNGGWMPFTKKQLDEFTNQDFWFNKLVKNGPKDESNFIILGDDDKYRVTSEFVAACFKASPAV